MQKLSIYLLKEKTSPKDALKGPQNLEKYNKRKGWEITIKNPPPNKPNWAEYLNLNFDIKTSNASAVLFIPHKKRYFAICFGYGHNLLKIDKFVNDFGITTGLNALDKNKIKSSDVLSPSDHSKQRRTQTVLNSNLQGHDIDGFLHILRQITGKTKEEYKELFKNVSVTSESLKIGTEKPVEELNDLCSKIFSLYSKKEDYKKDFPEIFSIRPLKDKSEIIEKENLLVKELRKKEDNIYLDIPELVDFQDVDKYRVNIKNRKRYIFEELNIEDCFYNLVANDDITIENLNKWEIILLNTDGKEKKFSLFKCIIFDCSYRNKNYHFSHGKWYCIDPNFSEKIDKKLNKRKKDKIHNKKILRYNHKDENDYNNNLSKNLEKQKCFSDVKCLDFDLVQMGGHDKIEPCDVLCVSKEENLFIHVKIKHSGSSGLSHLFEQGDVSLTLLNNKDRKFIDGIKKKVPNFSEEKRKIIHYIVISKTKNNKLPLFARICLFKTIGQIESKGASVFWSIIKNE